MADGRELLRSSFRWITNLVDDESYADVTGWWRDADILEHVGPALLDLFGDEQPTVVLGVQSRGTLLGALTARSAGIGLAEVRKNPSPSSDADPWWVASTPPDYRDTHIHLGVRKGLLRAGDRVLFVDDWIATGAQADACRRMVEMSGARWIGAAVAVDGLQDAGLRRRLGVRSLLHIRELG